MTNPPAESQGSNTVNSRGEVVAGEAGYASLPPPGSITSPPTPAYFSPVPTPPSATTRSASAAQPYPTYQDGLPPAPHVLYHTPYVPRQPGPNGLGSPFIPMAGNQAENLVGNAYAFNEVMSTLQSLSHNAGYPLGEPFNLLPPNDIMHVASMARGDPANGYHPQGSHGAHGRSDSGNQRSANAPYRPPHVQRKAALDVPPHLTLQRQAQGMAGNPFFGMPDARDNWWQNPQNQMAEIHRQTHPVGNGANNGNGSVRRKDNQRFGPTFPGQHQPGDGRSTSARQTAHNQTYQNQFLNAFGMQNPKTVAFAQYGVQNGAVHGFPNGAYTQSRGNGSGFGAPMKDHNPFKMGDMGRAYPAGELNIGARSGAPRSVLLEDYRMNKMNRKWDITELQGYMVEFANDQHGSRFIQTRLETCSKEIRNLIFKEITPSTIELMTDVFGNYVIQKAFDLGDDQQKKLMVKQMEGQVLALSMHMYGCRVIQKALEHVNTETRQKLVTELEPHIKDCVTSSNANHVIQRLITLDPPQSLPDAFVGHVVPLSRNSFGCRVLQRMFEQLPDHMIRELLDEMHPHAIPLMEDQYGNYVVQSVITKGNDEDKKKVVDQIKGRMLALCRHKFASNVCEKALVHCDPKDRKELIDELVDEKPNGSSNIGMLLRDAFGNFSIQTALRYAEPEHRNKLVSMVVPELTGIRNTPVGKRLEATLLDWENNGQIPPGLLITSISKPMSKLNMNVDVSIDSSTGESTFRSLGSMSSDMTTTTDMTSTTDSAYTPKSPSTSSTSVGDDVQNDAKLRSTASTPIKGVASAESTSARGGQARRGRMLDPGEATATVVGAGKRDLDRDSWR